MSWNSLFFCYKGVMKIHFYPVFVPLVVIIVIQIVKLMIDWLKNKNFERKNIFTTWGFPSVHSGMTSSLVTLVYLDQWLASISFAMAFVFMFLISYDAMNLRYETGKHAHYINSLRVQLEGVLQKQTKSYLKERIWHTPSEVIWWLLFGCIFTILLYRFVYVW